MRRLLPLALLLVACAKPTEPASTPQPGPAAGSAAKTPDVPAGDAASLTPEGMAKAMDVPLYPGAEAPDGLSSTPERRKDGSTHYSLVLATKDPVDKAAKWYADKLGLSSMASKSGKTIIGKTPRGNDLIVIVAPEAGRTLVRIKSIAYKG